METKQLLLEVSAPFTYIHRQIFSVLQVRLAIWSSKKTLMYSFFFGTFYMYTSNYMYVVISMTFRPGVMGTCSSAVE